MIFSLELHFLYLSFSLWKSLQLLLPQHFLSFPAVFWMINFLYLQHQKCCKHLHQQQWHLKHFLILMCDQQYVIQNPNFQGPKVPDNPQISSPANPGVMHGLNPGFNRFYFGPLELENDEIRHVKSKQSLLECMIIAYIITTVSTIDLSTKIRNLDSCLGLDCLCFTYGSHLSDETPNTLRFLCTLYHSHKPAADPITSQLSKNNCQWQKNSIQ